MEELRMKTPGLIVLELCHTGGRGQLQSPYIIA